MAYLKFYVNTSNGVDSISRHGQPETDDLSDFVSPSDFKEWFNQEEWDYVYPALKEGVKLADHPQLIYYGHFVRKQP